VTVFSWKFAKWFAALFEAYFLLLFTTSALFVPYPYNLTRILWTAGAALVAGAFALLGSVAAQGSFIINRKVLLGLPLIVWLSVVGLVLSTLLSGSPS
jgi:uncharacterized PurR-regulated membrane protein YhhQ (DUF165 family)